MIQTIALEGKEVGIAHDPPDVDRPLEDAHRAVLLTEAKLLDGLVHAQQRRDDDPAEPAIRFRGPIRQPAVVAPTDR